MKTNFIFIVQKFEFYKSNDPNDFPVEVWADTDWASLEEAQLKYPDTRYRMIKVIQE